ncbi:general stress protein, partial [Escherichia coli]
MTEHRGGAGNFAEDRQKASDAGRKGGQHSGGEFLKKTQKKPKKGEKKRGEKKRGGGKIKLYFF